MQRVLRFKNLKTETLKGRNIKGLPVIDEVAESHGVETGLSGTGVLGAVQSATSGTQIWQRVGNTVKLFGTFSLSVDNTSGDDGAFLIPLPVASDFLAQTDAAGIVMGGTVNPNRLAGTLEASVAENRLSVNLNCNGIFTTTIYYSAIYNVSEGDS